MAFKSFEGGKKYDFKLLCLSAVLSAQRLRAHFAKPMWPRVFRFTNLYTQYAATYVSGGSWAVPADTQNEKFANRLPPSTLRNFFGSMRKNLNVLYTCIRFSFWGETRRKRSIITVETGLCIPYSSGLKLELIITSFGSQTFRSFYESFTTHSDV